MHKDIIMVVITSTWEAIGANNSPNALQGSVRTVSDIEAKNFNFDADSMIDFESCTQLTKPTKCPDSKCNLTISSAKHLSFSRIIIISESKRAEILDGNSEEYMFTKPAVLLDDSDPDMIMYKNDITLEKSCNTSIKLYLTGISESCWLLGLFVFTTKIELIPPNVNGFFGITKQTRFDIEQMNSLLKETELSGKAQSFKSLFETFQKTGPYTASNELTLDKLSLASSQNSDLLSDISSTLSAASNKNTLTSAFNDTMLNGKLSSCDNLNLVKEQYLIPSSLTNQDLGDCKCNHNCCKRQSVIFKESLKQIETNVIHRIVELEKKQDDKFNQILEILSKSTSNDQEIIIRNKDVP